MARNQSRSPVTGKHRVARRTKIAMGAIGLAIAVGGLAVAVTTGRTGEASADQADASFFIDINKVPRGNNVNKSAKQGAQGSFTVDCGTNADSSIQSLLKGGTTCKNGDKSAYFWPVIRIDKEDKAAGEQKNQQEQQKQKGKTADVQGQDEAANAEDQAAAQDAQGQQNKKQQNKKQDQNNQQQDQNGGGAQSGGNGGDQN